MDYMVQLLGSRLVRSDFHIGLNFIGYMMWRLRQLALRRLLQQHWLQKIFGGHVYNYFHRHSKDSAHKNQRVLVEGALLDCMLKRLGSRVVRSDFIKGLNFTGCMQMPRMRWHWVLRRLLGGPGSRRRTAGPTTTSTAV